MRKLIAQILTWQAKRYLQKYAPKIVVIAGSVGKTSTTHAIATVLSESHSVKSTIANYNTDVGVPCSIFGQHLPSSLKNPFAWLILFVRNEFVVMRHPAPEFYVLELGSDLPGEIMQFAWLKPDLAVVTAVADEHMENFKTLDGVAEEELSVARYSQEVLVNKKMVDASYLQALNVDADFYERSDLKKFKIDPSELQVIGEHSLDAIVAALTVGDMFGMDGLSLRSAVGKIQPRNGRMSRFEGIQNSTLIDDTYNASPAAVIAALDYIYSCDAPQRIALLGNMNELGEVSKGAHIQIGEYCDPEKLDVVVTLGPDANAYTATAARAQGCTVFESKTPYEAADIIKDHMKEGALVLLKGSQNQVFAEEATLKLLANPDDASRLVRQSVGWKTKKLQNFGKPT